MKIADFFAQIGFKVDTKGLQDFNDGMTTVVNTVKGLALGLVGAMSAWELLQLRIGKSSQSMITFKLRTGESIAEVRKLATVMQATNLNFSMDTLLSDVSRFKENVRKGQIFGEGGPIMQAFRAMGISSLGDGGIKTIEELLDKLALIPDRATRSMMLHMAQLDDQWLYYLDLSKEERDRLYEENKDMFPSPEEIERRTKATIALNNEWLKLVNTFQSKVTDFAPILLDILKRIRDIISDTDRLERIIEGIKWFFIIYAITMIASGILNIVNGLTSIIQLAGKAGAALLGLGGGAAAGGAAAGAGAEAGVAAGAGAAAGAASRGLASKGAAAIGLKGIAKEAAKIAGKRVAAGAAASAAGTAAGGVPGAVIAALFALWAGWDVFKFIYSLKKLDNDNKSDKSNNVLPDLPPLPDSLKSESASYDWNKTLASMSINAQNVYIQAAKVYGGGGNFSSSMTDNNVARSLYDMEKW